jgi:hypothetical protein
MAHYAFLNENNIVTEVIVGKDEGENNIDWEQHYGEVRGQICKRTCAIVNQKFYVLTMGHWPLQDSLQFKLKSYF